MIRFFGGTVNKVPVIYTNLTNQNVSQLKRVAHAAVLHKQGKCYIPLYSPIFDVALEDLKRIFDDVQVDAVGAASVKVYKQLMKLQKAQYLKTDFKFITEPYKHQKESLLKLIYNFRWNLSIDPGLGKTKIAIDYLRYIQRPALILAPTSLLKNWVREFETHGGNDLKVCIFAQDYKPKYVPVLGSNGEPIKVDGKVKKKLEPTRQGKIRWLEEMDEDIDVLLVGYHSAASYKKEIMAYYNYDVIILDESHRIKSFKSKNSEGARELSQKAYRRVTMSGTYILNSPIDAWPQMDFLSPQILNKGFYAFRDKYCVFHKDFRHQIVGYKNLDQLGKVIDTFSTVVTKDQVKDLPSRTVVKRHFDLTKEQVKWYEDIISDDDLEFEDGNIAKEHRVALLMKLAQVCKGYVHLSNKKIGICDGCNWVGDCVANRVKPYTSGCNVVQKIPEPTKRRLKSNPALDVLTDLLEELLENKSNKVIIWYRGIEECSILSEVLTDVYKFVQVTDAQSLDSKIETFENDPSVRVLLCSIAKGIGFTANAARYSIFFSLGFSLEHFTQSRDRNHRVNTPHSVTEYHILGSNSIEEEIIHALEHKQDVVDTLVGADTCTMCLHANKCKEGGVQRFGKGCKLKKKVSRPSININKIGEKV